MVKKIAIIIISFLIASLSYVYVLGKEEKLYCVSFITKNNMSLKNIKIDLYYLSDISDVVNNMSIDQKEGYFIKSIYSNEDGCTVFYSSFDNLFFKIDLASIPAGYGVPHEYYELYESDIEIAITKIKEAKKMNGITVYLDENRRTIVANDDKNNLLSNDKIESINDDISCIDDTDYTFVNDSGSTRSVIFDSTNPSLSPIFDSLYISSPIYNRFIICHNGLSNDQIQMISDEICAIELFFVSSCGFMIPETNNGYYYIVVGNFVFNSMAFVEDQNGFNTQYTYMKLMESLFNQTAIHSYKVSIAHEYFHSITQNYTYNKSINHRFWFFEHLATFAAFVYVNQIVNLSSTDFLQIKESYRSYPKSFYNDKFISNCSYESLNGTDHLYGNEYSSFVFALFIYQEYGGMVTYKKMFERVASSSTMIDTYQIYVDTLNNDCGYNISSFKDLFQEFCIFAINSRDNFICQSNLKEILINYPCEIENNIMEHTINGNHYIYGMAYTVCRFDVQNFARVRNRITLTINTNGLQNFYNDIDVIFYYGNKYTGDYTVYYNSISSNTPVNIYNCYFGIDYYDYCIVMIINKSTTAVNINFNNQFEYIPYDNAEYMIACESEDDLKYLTIDVDEYNCTTMDRNVYLYDYLDSIRQYFIIKEISNGSYYILTKATSYYPDLYSNMRIGICNSNIYTICDGYWNDSLFSFYNTDFYYYKIFKSGYSTNVIKAVNFLNGSNEANQLSSNGNVILSYSFNNTYLEKWRFYPIEGV